MPEAPESENPSAAPAGDALANARPRRRWLRTVLLVAGPLLVATGAAWVYITGGRYAETENAYVKADKVAVSAQVAGPITEVLVHENEPVKRGQVLFRIDDAEFQVAMSRAQARMRGMQALVDSLRAGYRQKLEELERDRVDAEYKEREFERQSTLAQDNLASRSRLDEARNDRDVARKQIAITEQALAQLRAQLGGNPAIAIESHPVYMEAKAAYDEAELNLQHTVVRAPFDGVVQRKPEPGQYVRPGEPVMAIVAEHDVWIEANYKETELTHVRSGQQVSIRVDTYPDHVWQGTVESLSQASGAEFSVLPPQNATGNWVKVVQRIPVRIAVPEDPDAPPLRAGMSTVVEIDTGYQRPLPGIVRTALNLLGGATLPAATAGTGTH